MADGPRDFGTSAGLLLLRLGAGGYMATHGWGKVVALFEGKGPGWADPLGIGGTASLIGAAGTEFLCALLVAAGLATRFAAASVAFTMGVAAFIVHAADPWTMGEGARLFQTGAAKSWGSKEPALLFLIAFLALALTGAGRFSLDAWIASRRGGAGREGKARG